jgi:hypothetical protein
LDVFDGQVLVLATMRGPGVTLANDTVLWLLQEDGSSLLLLREGDFAPDCDGARIGVIQRVIAESRNGQYAVLASLTGAASTRDQALFSASTSKSLALKGLRRPFLKLRKGVRYSPELSSAGAILKSIALPASAFDATGAGAKGLGQPLDDNGGVVLKLTFSDNAVEILRGDFD